MTDYPAIISSVELGAAEKPLRRLGRKRREELVAAFMGASTLLKDRDFPLSDSMWNGGLLLSAASDRANWALTELMQGQQRIEIPYTPPRCRNERAEVIVVNTNGCKTPTDFARAAIDALSNRFRSLPKTVAQVVELRT